MTAKLLSLLVFVAILFAGCAGGSAKETTAPSSVAPAPAATVTEETGSIAGTIANEELLPISGATLGLVETSQETQSDAQGKFTFNDLAAGTYTLVAQRLGFESAAKKLDVTPGEVTEVKLQMASVSISMEPFVLTVPRVSLIVFGNAYTQFATQSANQTHDMFCQACVMPIHFSKAPVSVMIEAEWQCGCTDPVVNMDVWFKIITGWSTGALDGTVQINNYLSNREQFVWTDKQVDAIKKEDKYLFLLHAGNYINQDNRVNTYHSFAYNEDFAEGFSALSPV